MFTLTTAIFSLRSFQFTAINVVYPRRLLLHAPLHQQPAAIPPSGNLSTSSATPESSFDANVIMILAVLLCALICALGLNSIVRCALRCSSHMTFTASSAAQCSTGGVKKKALKSLPTLTYSEGLKLPGAGSECAICLSEFTIGVKVRVLPTCNHGFHVKCINRWLAAHASCPTCRQCLNSTCPKIFHCTTAAQAIQSILPPPPLPPPPPRPVLNPLDPEGVLIDYRDRY